MACLPAKSIVDILRQVVNIPEGAISFNIDVDRYGFVKVDCVYSPKPNNQVVHIPPHPM